jgi:DNA helicase HerA-like ATPase
MYPMNSFKHVPVIGIKGKAGAGKTTLARELRKQIEQRKRPRYHVDHVSFALLLYELATIKSDIQGVDRKDRQLYRLHETVKRLLGENPLFGAPPYDELVELVHHLYDMPLDGDKPREFLLEAAALLREYDDQVFIKDLERTVNYRHDLFMSDYDDDLDIDPDEYIVIISDVRYEHEAQFIKSFATNSIIEVNTSSKERRIRSAERGDRMNYDEVENLENMHYNWNVKVDKQFNGSVPREELAAQVIKYFEEEAILV